MSRRMPVAITVGVAALLLAACSGGTEGSGSVDVPAWTAPDSYTYTVDSGCGERALIGSFRITVENGEVVDAEALGNSAESVVERLDELPTLDDLLDEARVAARERADELEVTMSPDGYPEEIRIDWERDAIDDEACYVIEDFEPGS